ncbi:MAG: hypothetical protein EOM44_14945 [Bacteroidia bacterium]|nr:hypothetical protein [Bacteroidia bacterium]
MFASLFRVSSQDYIRLLESGSLDFFSQFSCFFCDSRLWRNGYRQRCYPVSIKLVRLKCQNPKCNCHYTVYPSDVFPRYRHNPETILTLTTVCLKASSSLEQSLCNYQHGRERRIEDGESGGPDVSTLRRWLKSLFAPVSILSLFLSAQEQPLSTESADIMVVLLVASLATQLLERTLSGRQPLSPKAPVTDPTNQSNGGVSSQNDLNFYKQEHPP